MHLENEVVRIIRLRLESHGPDELPIVEASDVRPAHRDVVFPASLVLGQDAIALQQ